jgi:polysaccharide biosynthesis/export protein
MNADPKRLESGAWFRALILALLAFSFWLPPSAHAGDPPPVLTNAAPSNAVVGETDSTNRMNALDDRHKLAIGDRLSFRIVEDEDDPKEIPVTVSGDLEVPYIGRYPAVGLTCRELAWKLKAELEKKYYYHATVIIAVNDWARSQGKIYITGPVHVPGPQDIPSDEVLTLSKAILRAGGFGDYANRHKVEVRRKSATPGGKDQVFTVDVAEILDKRGTDSKRRTESDLPLEPGDLIYVPERLVRF